MKLEEFLMQRNEQKQKRLVLEEEVLKLQEELDVEQTLNRVLHCALHGPVASHPSLLALLPPQVLELFSELEMVEDEIIGLENKMEELKMMLYRERVQTRECEVLRRQWKQNQALLRAGDQSLIEGSRSQKYEAFRRGKRRASNRRASVGSASDMHRWNFSRTDAGEIVQMPRRLSRRSKIQSIGENETYESVIILKPNELSEQLLKCLIGIFLELKQTSLEKECSSSSSSSVVPKLTLPCMNTKGLMSKTSLNCKSLAIFNYSTSRIDPYCIFPDLDAVRDVGPYNNFIQITRSSLDTSRLPYCSDEIEKLRRLMHQLCDVDLTNLTYKQKLAFWINIYNACIMHAFLEHGLPSTQEKLLALMNKAALNVGGIVLNSLAIEHFILRHPSEIKHGPAYEKEMLLRHAYGLRYPEPNVTFALCRGSWSSPALRVYTSEEIVNELERAKVEYLEASVGVTSKKRIMVPKLLQRHMRDFADDMDSLLEWIYSQLPRSASLKRLMMECLTGEAKSPVTKIVEVQAHESEFRYLLPL